MVDLDISAHVRDSDTLPDRVLRYPSSLLARTHTSTPQQIQEPRHDITNSDVWKAWCSYPEAAAVEDRPAKKLRQMLALLDL